MDKREEQKISKYMLAMDELKSFLITKIPDFGYTASLMLDIEDLDDALWGKERKCPVYGDSFRPTSDVLFVGIAVKCGMILKKLIGNLEYLDEFDEYSHLMYPYLFSALELLKEHDKQLDKNIYGGV